MSVTDGDRRTAGGLVSFYRGLRKGGAEDPAETGELAAAIARALAEEREKVRAQVASDLRDLINDSGGQVWTRALLDFAEGLEAK